MFFTLSKILWLLLKPANVIFLLLAGGLVLRLRFRRIGGWMIVAATALLVIFGVLPVGANLLHGLESRYVRPDPMPRDITGIVVLGGAIDVAAALATGRPELNEAADRVIAGLALARMYPDARLVFSGGSGDLHDSTPHEARQLAILLRDLGIVAEGDGGRVMFEDTSRNTYENILHTKNIVQPALEENWILVTSAYHMPRAMAVAQGLGWSFVPYPVDYLGPGHYVFRPDGYDVLGSLYKSELALREWIGMRAYGATGRL